ncbi:MAG: hypothetical protein LBJ00_00445 [Planctomycetaceae bacterium]|nr:hypothetical protein [Planctomycetaceae bacterium]
MLKLRWVRYGFGVLRIIAKILIDTKRKNLYSPQSGCSKTKPIVHTGIGIVFYNSTIRNFINPNSTRAAYFLFQ